MTRNFTGSATHKLDAKGRVSLPSAFRDVLRASGAGAPSDAVDEFMLIPAWGDEERHLAMTLAGHDELVRTLSELAFDSQEEEEATRLRYIGLARRIAVEEGGRFVLSRDLREPLALDGSVHFVGDGGTFQLWNPDTFAARMAPAARVRPRTLSMARIGQ